MRFLTSLARHLRRKPIFNGMTSTGITRVDDFMPELFVRRLEPRMVLNAAPVLSSVAPILLDSISEDAIAPQDGDNVGTPVGNIVGLDDDVATPDNVADDDENAVTGIAIVGFDDLQGSLFYTIDGGSNWSELTSATTESALVLAADADTSIFYQANGDLNGTIDSAITFVAWDQTVHENGDFVDTTVVSDTSLSSTSDTASIVVTPIADAPVIASITTAEDTLSDPFTIGISDADGAEVTHFQISNITGGTLTKAVGGSEVSNDDFIAVGESLEFMPDADANSPSTTFNFTAIGSLDGTTVDAASPATIGIITVTPIADAPVIAPITTAEDTLSSPFTIGVSTVDGAEVTHFQIGNITGGTLTKAVGGSQVINGDFIAIGEALRFMPDADANSPSTTFSFTAVGSLDGTTVDAASPATVGLITVAPVNDVPTLVTPAPVTLLEDVFTSVNGLSINDAANEQVVLTLTASNGTLTLTSIHASLTVSGNGTASVSIDGQVGKINDALNSLHFQGNENFNGQDTIGVHLVDPGKGNNASYDITSSFIINVTAVNDAPSFVKGVDQTVNEDTGAHSVTGWATSIDAGAADEDVAGQQLTFNVTTDADELFAIGPAISTDGTLTYTLVADANGLATVTVILEDDGLSGGANGDVNTSASQQFEINIIPINDAPSFHGGPDQTVDEDAGSQTVIDWATDVIAGPDNESDQQLTFDVVTNPASAGLFSVAPAISSDGTLTYTTAADANGTATVTVTLSDDGPADLDNVNVNTSGPQTFTITIVALNDAPTFTAGPNQYAFEDAGLQTVTGWATAMDAGPADESEQTLTFQVTTNAEDEHLFSQLPSIDTNGNLTYETALNKNGSATVTVTLVDDGASGDGNVNTSEPHEFTIEITPVNDAPILNFQQAVSGNEDEQFNLVFPADVDLPAIIDVDADENPGQLSLQLSVGSGSLILGTTDGLSFDVGTNNSASMTVSGFLDDLNAALSSLQYQGDLNANVVNSGIVTVSVVIDDQGNSGIFPYYDEGENEDENESLTDSGQIAVTVDPVNDKPIFYVESGEKEEEWTSNEDAMIKLDRLRIEDVDFLETAGGVMSVHIWTGAGQLSHGDGSGLASVSTVAGAANIQATGSLDSLQDFLNELTYQPEADFFGELNFSITVNDLGNTGDGNELLAQKDFFEITILPVNDPPRFVSPADPTVVVHVDAGTPITVSIADVFAGPSNEFFASVHNDLPVQMGVKFVATPRSNAVEGDIITVLNGNDGTLKFIPNQLSGFSVVIDVIATDEGGTDRGGIDTTTTSFTLTVVVDTIPTPPIQTPAPPQPTFPVLSRADNSMPSNRVADAPVSTTESSAAGSDAASTEEKSIVVRRVIERNGGETVEEEKVVVWEYSELEKLTDRLRQLPDQRYRIYLQHEDGTQVRIREVYVRRGNLLDPADLEAARTEQTTDDTPRAEASTSNSKDGPADQEQAAEQVLPAAPDFGRIDTTEPMIEPTSALLTASSVVVAARPSQSRGRSLSQAARRLRSSVSYREITG